MELELVSIKESSQGWRGNGWQECWYCLIIQTKYDYQSAGVPRLAVLCDHKQPAPQRKFSLDKRIGFPLSILQLGFKVTCDLGQSVAAVIFVFLGFSTLVCHWRSFALVLVQSFKEVLKHESRKPVVL